MNKKKLRIMRAILRTMYSYRIPQDLPTVLCAPELRLEAPSPIEANSAWMELISCGLLIALPNYDNQVAKLPGHIRQQMDNDDGNVPRTIELYGSEVM